MKDLMQEAEVNGILKQYSGGHGGVEANDGHLTDTSNAEKIAELFGNKVRFDHRRRRWLIWQGHRWQPDIDGEINRLAVAAAKQRYLDATNIDDLTQRTLASKWAIQSESKMRLDAATAISKSLIPIADNGDNWDKDTNLLSCPNGIVDLKTGTLRDGRAEDRITMSTGVAFDPGAECPRWEKFINEIFEGNEELIRFVHKSLGYTLTGDMREQVVFFCYGTGSNGKSVLFSTLRNVFGDYAHDTPFHTFQRNQTTSSNDLASLELKRLVLSSEVLAGRKIDESRLKNISGGDSITARYLYSESFTFTPHCKIWLFVNRKPIVTDDSYGFWRRVRLIPFNRIFKPEEQDKQLMVKLQSEMPGILNWLIKGCLMWRDEGLFPVPSSVLEATAEYQQESDTLAEFLNEMCESQDGEKTKASELWKTYQAWAIEQGYDKKDMLGSKAFYVKMGEKFKKIITNQGNYYYGISIKSGGSTMSIEAKVEVHTQNLKNTYIHSSRESFIKNAFEAPLSHEKATPTSTGGTENISNDITRVENHYAEQADLAYES